MSRIFSMVFAAILVLATTPSLLAKSAEELAQTYFYTIDRAERQATLTEIISAAETDPAARFVHGMTIFLNGIEKATIRLNRHGFQLPTRGPLGRMLGMRNSRATPTQQYAQIDYQTLRNILTDFDSALAAAAGVFAAIPADAEFEVSLDFAQATIDVGDDTLTSGMAFGKRIFGTQRRSSSKDSKDAKRDLAFTLDRADAYWLEGYSHVVRATSELILAHDFERNFDLSFSVFFPYSMPPSPLNPQDQAAQTPGPLRWANWNDTRRFADIISFIHLFDLPVVNPERRAAVRTHLLEMIRLSRENWKSINAETDDNAEWLPGPHQPQSRPLTGAPVTEKQIAAWHKTLDTFEAILNGDLLVPHWRFPNQGINIKSFFEGTTNLDFILMLTGPAFVPYLEDGSILNIAEFRGSAGDFGPLGFIRTAFWFN